MVVQAERASNSLRHVEAVEDTRVTRSIAANPNEMAPPNVLFAQSPSDALQCLIDLKLGMQRVRLAVSEGTIPVSSAMAMDGPDWRDWEEFLSKLDPFFWPSHTANLVTAASVSYPLESQEAINLDAVARERRAGLVTAPPSYLPRRFSGLCVFEKPTLFVEIGGQSSPLSALAWMVGVNMTSRELWLSLRGVSWTTGFAAVVWWSDGGSIDADDTKVDATFRAERIAFTKWICTAAMFVEQEIVTESTVTPLRAVRKRCAKAGIEPTCHIVTLRKEIATDHQATGLSQVEWSHRWLVRGHWRRQFFPSRGANAPVWIHPHVKGPTDKPFIESKPTVYHVSR